MKTCCRIFTVLLVSASAASAGQNAALDRARDLYYSAAFVEALGALEELRREPSADVDTVDEYRAACLVALGRDEEARETVARLVRARPGRQPGVLSTSPATRELYESVRTDVLAEIVRHRYVEGTAALQGGRPADAARAFAAALRAIDELPADAARELSDFETLSLHFLDAAEAFDRQEPRSDPDHVYSGGDPGVVGPQPIRQQVPQPPDAPRIDFSGTVQLELLLSPAGAVERAYVHQGIHSAYDTLILEAARTWRYTPATVDGRPVRFRKLLRIDVR